MDGGVDGVVVAPPVAPWPRCALATVSGSAGSARAFPATG
ncbi:hypothetical protein ABH937_005605 [Kitasatospora sp. GAS1066B]